jgi:hypothetical protein
METNKLLAQALQTLGYTPLMFASSLYGERCFGLEIQNTKNVEALLVEVLQYVSKSLSLDEYAQFFLEVKQALHSKHFFSTTVYWPNLRSVFQP